MHRQQDWENLSAWPGLAVYGPWRMKEVLFESVHAVLGSDWDLGRNLAMHGEEHSSLKTFTHYFISRTGFCG